MSEKQFILNLRSIPSMHRNDYFVSRTNKEIINWIDIWPNWPHFCLLIYGPNRSGKSHLAYLLKDISEGTIIMAKHINKNNIDKLFSKKCIIVENLEKLDSENALFHLFNMCKENNSKIMFTSSISPKRINFNLPDLRSRILSVPAVELKFPDDKLLEQIIIKQFLLSEIIYFASDK